MAFSLLEQRISNISKKATSQRCARASAMTSEIDCTTRTKQKSTLNVDTLYRTRVRMLGQLNACTKCQQHSTHRYSYKEAPESSSNSSSMRGALGDPVRPTSPRARGLVMAMFSQYWEYARVPGFEQQSVGTRAIFSSFVCSVSSNCRCYLGSFKRLQRLWYESKFSQ